MSKRSIIIAGIVALAAIALGTALMTTDSDEPSPGTLTNGTTSAGNTSTVAATGTAPGTQPGQNAGGTQTPPNGANPSNPTAGTNTNPGLPALKPFPQIPDSGRQAQQVTAPVESGEALTPLTEAPEDTVSALKLGTVADGTRFIIQMRPYGYGPSSFLGSGVVIRIDSSTPPTLAKDNYLVIANTTDGGGVTKGGTYTAVVTFRSDGSKLIPILSKAKLTE